MACEAAILARVPCATCHPYSKPMCDMCRTFEAAADAIAARRSREP